MPRRPYSLSLQISRLALAFGLMLALGLGLFGWWAATSIDDRAIAQQTRAIHRGLVEVMERIPVEQDSSAIWDDAVRNLRAGDDAWIAENLAEWMSAYFGHERVYILDPADQLVRAVQQGVEATPALYAADSSAIAPLLSSLRDQMARASRGLEDSTQAVTGMGVEDIVVTGDGQVAVASIRPIIPSSDAVRQTPGTEYVHVSLRLLNAALTAEIAEHYEIPSLAFEVHTGSTPDRVATPVLDQQDRIMGFYTWTPERPAFTLIRDTFPAICGSLIAAAAAVYVLLRRLRRTSSQLEEKTAEASFLAFHDPMTKLPNRALFEDRLEQALANMRTGQTKVALHYVDLDNFKRINDTLGHVAGDDLLRQAAARLGDLVGAVDTVARLGGDEFSVIQFNVADAAEAFVLAQRIVEAFEKPFKLSGHEGQAGASVGVVLVADPNLPSEDIMRQADLALYEAKGAGRGRFQAYDGELSAQVREKRELEMELREAVNGKPGLELVYQPIFDARTSFIAGAEALVRWDHPSRGRMAPAAFIGLAEERGLIDQLGLWVLRGACKYAASSQLPWIAVNVSPMQFRDERFADRVFEILETTGLLPDRLEIEITEGLLLQNSPLIQNTLRRLRARGIRVALDDFGTGYSSISYLRTYGIDKLKIDQSYTAQLGHDPEIDSIVRSIVDLGRAMHMTVTAEGVETRSQSAILNGIGCDQLQGYLLSRPLLPSKLDDMLRQSGSPDTAIDLVKSA